MSSTRDNPIARFSALIWGLGIFLIFAVGLTAVYLFNREDPTTLEDNAAKVRYETKKEVFAAQEKAVSDYKEVEPGKKVQVPPHDVFDLVGKQLAITKPAATKELVPGSATDKAQGDGPVDPAVMEAGKAAYLLCSACHGQNGEGGPAGPPHAGSEWVTGPVENLIRIQMRGLQGPITVKGQAFTAVPVMPPAAYQTDEQIAAVLTYVRNSFGNKASSVTPAQVKALRGEEGKPMLTEADLKKP